MEGDSATYNIHGAVRLTGNLNRGALEKAIGEIVGRHEVLRTRFPSVNGTPIQVIELEANFQLEIEDWQHLGPSEQANQVRAYSQLEAQIPFNLATGPLLRGTLLQLSDTESVLLFTMHHK
ncbi:MAG: condensation domain-containing protein [Xenococcaceae cyanobacterium]